MIAAVGAWADKTTGPPAPASNERRPRLGSGVILAGVAVCLVLAVAFVIFLALVGKLGGFKALAGGLDKRSQRIAGELGEAKRLREEAQALLASYEKRRREAETEAETIISQAKAAYDTSDWPRRKTFNRSKGSGWP